jgi:hypothetical protein
MSAAPQQLALFTPPAVPEAAEIQRAVALIRRERLGVDERLAVLAVVCRVELGRRADR